MRIRETKTEQVGRGGLEVKSARVRIIAATDPLPAGAVAVDDKTELHDWKEITEEEAK